MYCQVHYDSDPIYLRGIGEALRHQYLPGLWKTPCLLPLSASMNHHSSKERMESNQSANEI